jgi:hypothetical protein
MYIHLLQLNLARYLSGGGDGLPYGVDAEKLEQLLHRKLDNGLRDRSRAIPLRAAHLSKAGVKQE